MNKDKILKYLPDLEDIVLATNDDNEATAKGLLLDVESTGTNVKTDKVIQISVIPFEFTDESHKIVKVYPAYTSYNDPREPISELITKLTGITNEDVKGQKINREKLRKLFERVDIVVAHYAEFDRNILENNFPELRKEEVIWICSVKDPNWEEHFMTSAKLDYVAFRLGFWFEHHSADTDTRALLQILLSNFPDSDINIFTDAIQNVLSKSTSTVEVRAPFSEKDVLKNAGYRWNGDKKVWWTKSTNPDETEKWLDQALSEHETEVVPDNVFERFRK